MKLWLISSLFFHFWILLHLWPEITIGKEKGSCWFFFFHRRKAICVLSKLQLLATCEQGPEWHFYRKLNHLVYCYVSCCHSVKICLYLHAKNFSKIFYCPWQSLKPVAMYDMVFRWKEEVFSVISLKTRIKLQVVKNKWWLNSTD